MAMNLDALQTLAYQNGASTLFDTWSNYIALAMLAVILGLALIVPFFAPREKKAAQGSALPATATDAPAPPDTDQPREG